MRDRARQFFQSKVRWLAFKLSRNKNADSSIPPLARNYVIEASDSGLVSLMGGCWTTFRSQGEQTVNRILKDHPDQFKDTLRNEEG